MQVDFSLNVQCATGAPLRSFTETEDWYDPDCDHGPVPVPVGGHVEGESGYACLDDGDCHLIVVDPKTQTLWEQWRVDADAGGFPMAALLFDADEVDADAIHHAIRFILPNDRIRADLYVHPATHGTSPPNGATGGVDSPPYGARLRLRADFPMNSLPNRYARAAAHAMQTYGMILSDGGSVALTAENDEHTVAKWDFDTDDRTKATGLGPRDLDAIHPDDFVMVEGGTRYNWKEDPGCVRNP